MKKNKGSIKSFFLLFVGATMLTSCMGMLPGIVKEEDRVQKVTEKAAWDLECGKEKLNIIKINDTSYGAEGCGKKASYVMDKCTSNAMGGYWASVCTAVLNSEISSTSAEN